MWAESGHSVNIHTTFLAMSQIHMSVYTVKEGNCPTQSLSQHIHRTVSVLFYILQHQETVMWRSVFLISLVLHTTAGNEGCTLSGTNDPIQEITAYIGQTVLLPCSCYEPQFDHPRLTWVFFKHGHGNEIKLTQNDDYIDRVKMFSTGTFTGNLSLLLSNFNEEDQGIYRCQITNRQYRDVRLNAKECTLSDTRDIDVTASPGQSVLLPCSCTDPKTKPHRLTWQAYKKIRNSWVTLTQSAKVKMFNTENSPGNLSVLLSSFTRSDVGEYRCETNHGQYRIIVVKESEQPKTLTTTKRPTVPPPKTPTTKTTLPTASKGGKGRNSGETPSTSLDPNKLIYILLVVLPVMLIIAGLALYIHRRSKGTKNKEKKSSGSKTGREQKHEDDPYELYSTFADGNTAVEEKTTPLCEDPSVTYSTIDHIKGKRKAAVSLESSGETEYVSIKFVTDKTS